MKGVVLVTGANGFVGHTLCKELSMRHFSVLSTVRSKMANVPYSTVLIDAIGPESNWFTALKEVRVVIHLAARVHVMHDTAIDPLEDFRKINVKGTLNLARQAAIAGVQRFVFISSVKVNGEQTKPGHAFTEADNPAPQDSYGISKMEAEQGLRKIAQETGMEVVIIRPPLVYGPGVKANFAALIQTVQKGWPLPLGAIHNQRSLIGLDNLVDFILTCTTHPLAANETFLISDDHDISTTELVQGLAKAAGKKSWLIPVPSWLLLLSGRLLGQRAAIHRLCGNLQVDISKAKQLLGWAPPISIEEGLRRSVQGNNSSS